MYMKSSHRLVLRFYRIRNSCPKQASISYRFNHRLAPSNTYLDAQLNPHPPPQDMDSPQNPAHDPAQILITHLSNCTNLSVLSQIHAQIIRTHMLESSHSSSFLWNCIIRSYTRFEAPSKALFLFVAMSEASVMPDSYTLPIVIKALCQVYDVGLGKQVHSMAIKHGLEANEFCESGFISFYCRAGEFGNAHKVFAQNRHRKLGSWNAILAGLSQAGRAKEAINLFLELLRSGLRPDHVTMVSVTSACGSLGDLTLALQLHKCVFQAECRGKSDILMLNSLVDMYGKCGRMDLANKVFSWMEQKNVSSWTSMIVGYAMHGHVNEALEFFRCMREAGVRPNSVTFVGVLSACVHGGELEAGKHYFRMMKSEYGIIPKLQHYGCMVDLLGKSGLLEEAREMLEDMPMEPNVVVWGCLMGACEKFGNVEIGEWVAKHLQRLEPWNDAAYVVLSNIYGSSGLWKEVEKVRDIMKARRLVKFPAYSLSTDST